MNDEMIFDIDGIVNETEKNPELIEDGDTEVNTEQENVQKDVETGSDSDFDIQIETFEKQGQISSSLCDRFGVHMFTDKFLKSEEQWKEEHKNEKERILKDVLLNQKESPLNDSFWRVMNTETRTVIKTEYQNEQNEMSMLSVLSYGFLGMFLTGIVLFYIEKRRRRKKNENRSYNQKQYDE